MRTQNDSIPILNVESCPGFLNHDKSGTRRVLDFAVVHDGVMLRGRALIPRPADQVVALTWKSHHAVDTGDERLAVSVVASTAAANVVRAALHLPKTA